MRAFMAPLCFVVGTARASAFSEQCAGLYSVFSYVSAAGENAAVLCGAQWVALPQLLNLSEAQRSQTANLRNPLVGSSHVDELVDTLSCESVPAARHHTANVARLTAICHTMRPTKLSNAIGACICTFDRGVRVGEIARRLPKYPIYLHVYNLGQAKSISGLNRFTNGMRLGGMFHGGVEIHGMEWSFGWADTVGVQCTCRVV
jgi:hypothetical protein